MTTMSDPKIFKLVLLLARPAAGKSEVIDYLKNTPLPERIARFHIGKIAELDDFPMLWTWFEEDGLLEKMGQPRLHTDAQANFLHIHLWDVLIERLCLEYSKLTRNLSANGQDQTTTIMEFSRGSEHGGFQRAFEHLSEKVQEDAGILYIQVSWEESLRKNRRRFNPDRPDSVLEHGLPDEKLARLYRETDWPQVSQGNPDYISILDRQIPYAVMENEDDVTTPRGSELGNRLETCLSHLWDRYTTR